VVVPLLQFGRSEKMSTENHHLKEAKKLYQKALEEFEKAKEKSDGTVLRDACGKGWLSVIEATYALLVKRGVKEEELPKGDRGRRYMVNKYFERELKPYYFFLREEFHIEGYYEGSLDFDEVQIRLDDLNLYIQKIEELEGVSK
jgi:uncharacterized protein (UPF0332 family)